MKKKIALFTVLIGMSYVLLTSYSGGTAFNSYNCSGAKGSVTSCGGAGTLCHGAATRTTANIRVDSIGSFWVAAYVPGMTYTVTVSGTNSTFQPEFGFQFTAVKGTGTSQTIAGSYAGFPTNVTSNIFSGLRFVEQTMSINAPTPGTYQESFQWVAPPAGSGTVTMYLTMLAVNGNNFQDTNDVSANTSITLIERAANSVPAMPELTGVSIYPNPVVSTLHFQIGNNTPGTYYVSVFGLNGKQVASQAIEVNNALQTAGINTMGWLPGLYEVVVEHDGCRTTKAVVKQ